MWGSAVGFKGGGVSLRGTSQARASAAGEIAPLVSVMSGQSLGVPGPEIGQVKGQIPSRAGPSYSALMMEGHHETFTAKSLLKLAAQPHYLNSVTT